VFWVLLRVLNAVSVAVWRVLVCWFAWSFMLASVELGMLLKVIVRIVVCGCR